MADVADNPYTDFTRVRVEPITRQTAISAIVEEKMVSQKGPLPCREQ
jgi:hypothetical protein